MDKSSPKFWTTSVFFKKLPKENNRPKGENSPNLVTLSETYVGSRGGYLKNGVKA
jgi:hypothetical protein